MTKAEKNLAIKEINKALGLIYDMMHPMPKVAISNILSKIKQLLKG